MRHILWVVFCFLSACSSSGTGAKKFHVETIIEAAPHAQQLVWAFIGDGYTAGEQSTFSQDVRALAEGMLLEEPFNQPAYQGRVNVYAIHAISEESGADDLLKNVHKNTYLNARYGEYGIDTLLIVDQAKAQATAFINVPSYDLAWVLVNDKAGGGSGGQAIVLSTHPANVLIGLHEFGHSFSHLADEYTRPYPGFPEGDAEPNVTYQTQRHKIPWKEKIADSTSVPTYTIHHLDTVGLFEGARYKANGIYRPQYNCRMRMLSYYIPFCSVCNDTIYSDMNNHLDVHPSLLIAEPNGVAQHE